MKLKDGYTLIHEHTTIDLSSLKKEEDCNLNCFEETIKEFQELYKYGVRNIIDVTTIGMGKNIEYVKKVQEATNINIIQSTGFYKEPFLPTNVINATIFEIVALMEKEISTFSPKIIGEIGTSLNEMTNIEKKVFDASIIISKKYNLPISTHTTLGTYGVQQAKYLIENGIKPEMIIIGHQDLCNDFQQILDLINLGVYVAFDTIGKNNYVKDEIRLEYILKLQKLNHLDQIVLSLDITRKSNMKYLGGIGYTHLFTSFIPLLRANGISESSIDLMLKNNPKKIFKEIK